MQKTPPNEISVVGANVRAAVVGGRHGCGTSEMIERLRAHGWDFSTDKKANAFSLAVPPH